MVRVELPVDASRSAAPGTALARLGFAFSGRAHVPDESHVGLADVSRQPLGHELHQRHHRGQAAAVILARIMSRVRFVSSSCCSR